MPVTVTDIDAFGQFAKQQIGGSADLSLQEILDKWHAKREAEETAEDIRQGSVDIDAGRGKPVTQAFSDVRRKLGLVE